MEELREENRTAVGREGEGGGRSDCGERRARDAGATARRDRDWSAYRRASLASVGFTVLGESATAAVGGTFRRPEKGGNRL
jgi:hypothetical protein